MSSRTSCGLSAGLVVASDFCSPPGNLQLHLGTPKRLQHYADAEPLSAMAMFGFSAASIGRIWMIWFWWT